MAHYHVRISIKTRNMGIVHPILSINWLQVLYITRCNDHPPLNKSRRCRVALALLGSNSSMEAKPLSSLSLGTASEFWCRVWPILRTKNGAPVGLNPNTHVMCPTLGGGTACDKMNHKLSSKKNTFLGLSCNCNVLSFLRNFRPNQKHSKTRKSQWLSPKPIRSISQQSQCPKPSKVLWPSVHSPCKHTPGWCVVLPVETWSSNMVKSSQLRNMLENKS